MPVGRRVLGLHALDQLRQRAGIHTCGSTRRSRRCETAAASSGRRSCSPTACTSRATGEVIALDVGEAERRRRSGGVPALARRARPERREAGRLRRPCRAQEGDRAGARLPLAALQRPLPARGARPRPPRAATDARRPAAPALRRRGWRAGARARRWRRSTGCASRCRRWWRSWRKRRRTCSPSTASPATTGRSCAPLRPRAHHGLSSR
jgi:hypothetical protein